MRPLLSFASVPCRIRALPGRLSTCLSANLSARMPGWVWFGVVLVSVLSAWWTPAAAASVGVSVERASEPVLDAAAFAQREEIGRALQRASDASIGVMTRAVEGSGSIETLGAVRKGSGVVIGSDGLVLTIGYLILEAEQIDLVMDDGRVIPARPLAYDLATGFGLVRALLPLPMQAVPLGDSSAVGPDETLMFVSGGHGGAVSPARLLARGQFAGYWEYLIDGALFTAPARADHSGAGLYNGRGELIGIGSLVFHDARANVRTADAWLQSDFQVRRTPGNLFVPVNLLKPILSELLRDGRSGASQRAWLGLNCSESDGVLTVMRVSRGSPAEKAGLQPGDRIIRLDGVAVGDLPSFYQRLWRGSAERDVHLEVGRGGAAQDLLLRTVDREAMIKRARGI